MIHVNLTFALSFPFHELHVRSMQIFTCKSRYTFRILLAGGRAIFFQVQTLWTNNLFCLKNNVIVSSRKQRSLHATQNSRQNLVEDLPPLRNLLGTLSKDDDDGSEKVGKNMNLRSFKLYRVYLDPLNMSNAGDFSWGWILKDFIQVQKEEGKFVFVCPRPSWNVQLGGFTS